MIKILDFINKIKGIATEPNDHKDDCGAVVIIKKEDGVYTEVTSDEDD